MRIGALNAGEIHFAVSGSWRESGLGLRAACLLAHGGDRRQDSEGDHASQATLAHGSLLLIRRRRAKYALTIRQGNRPGVGHFRSVLRKRCLYRDLIAGLERFPGPSAPD